MAKKRNKKRKRKPEFLRARNENRFGLAVVILAIFTVTVVVGIHSFSLRAKEEKYAAREQELTQLIEQENLRTEELKEFETYTKTKKYAEEVAKDKLGLVYENEIIFHESD